jgi:hypothetical protein
LALSTPFVNLFLGRSAQGLPAADQRHGHAAIELVLWLVVHLALRQAEGFAANVLRLLGQALRVPGHTTLSRRSRSLARRRPQAVPHRPMHRVIDSTGLTLFGQGEGDEEKQGGARRSWRKLDIVVDAGTREIVACVPTDNATDDAVRYRRRSGKLRARSRP